MKCRYRTFGWYFLNSRLVYKGVEAEKAPPVEKTPSPSSAAEKKNEVGDEKHTAADVGLTQAEFDQRKQDALNALQKELEAKIGDVGLVKNLFSQARVDFIKVVQPFEQRFKHVMIKKAEDMDKQLKAIIEELNRNVADFLNSHDDIQLKKIPKDIQDQLKAQSIAGLESLTIGEYLKLKPGLQVLALWKDNTNTPGYPGPVTCKAGVLSFDYTYPSPLEVKEGNNVVKYELKHVEITGYDVKETLLLDERQAKEQAEEEVKGAAFGEAFNKWQTTADDNWVISFTYKFGEPPQKVQKTVDLSYLRYMGSKDKVNLTIVARYYEGLVDGSIKPVDDKNVQIPSLANMFDSNKHIDFKVLPFLPSAQIKRSTTQHMALEMGPDKKPTMRAISSTETTQHTLDPRNHSTAVKTFDRQGRAQQEIVTSYVQVNQQPHERVLVRQYNASSQVISETSYDVDQEGNRVLLSRSEFDQDGNIRDSVNYVTGCDGVMAIDKPVMGPDGKPLMEDSQQVTSREMRFYTDANGNLIKVEQFNVWKKTHPGQSLHDYYKAMDDQHGKAARLQNYEDWTKENPGKSTDDYAQYLAGILKRPNGKPDFVKIHAYLAAMFKYTPDPDDLGDDWQTPDETFQKKDKKKRHLVDCEDEGFAVQKIFSKFEPRIEAQVLKLPGHAECVYVYKDERGKYHAVSMGTFGVGVDDKRVGKDFDVAAFQAGNEQTAGSDTLQAALEQLQPKWGTPQSFNIEMHNGELMNSDGQLSIMSILKVGKFDTTQLKGNWRDVPEDKIRTFKGLEVKVADGKTVKLDVDYSGSDKSFRWKYKGVQYIQYPNNEKINIISFENPEKAFGFSS